MLGQRTLILERAGKKVNANSSAEVIQQAGLDWKVKKEQLYRANYKKIENNFATVRQDTDTVLGFVTDHYNILQNDEAFKFMDKLVGKNEIEYFSAGFFKGGKKVWVSAKLPETFNFIEGEDKEKGNMFIVATYGHDGKSAIKFSITPVRIVCNNVLNLAIKKAKRNYSVTHSGNLKEKIKSMYKAMELSANYQQELSTIASRLVAKKINREEIMEKLFPINKEKDNKVRINNITQKREQFMEILDYREDVKPYKDTGWGIVNAVSEMVSHSEPKRRTITYVENTLNSILEGHKLVDKAFNLVGV